MDDAQEKLDIINNLSLDGKQKEKTNIDNILKDLTKLSDRKNELSSIDKYRLDYLLDRFNKISNDIIITGSVSDNAFPFSGYCEDC